jgi:branched-subunit amino acid transport protein
LSALILPEVLYSAGALDVSLDNPRLPATVAASVFLLYRPSIVGCIAIGMAVYVLFRFW